MSADDHIPPSNRWNRVLLHNKFVNGLRDTPQWTDWARLSDAELAAIQKFIFAVLNKQDLEGSNKPSWLAGTLHKIDDPKVQVYKEWAAWHYHCGPTYRGRGAEPTEWWLHANAQGRQSPEIIHYSRKQVAQPPGQLALTIVAFSREHKPFPDGNDYRNPLGERLRTLTDSTDAR